MGQPLSYVGHKDSQVARGILMAVLGIPQAVKDCKYLYALVFYAESITVITCSGCDGDDEESSVEGPVRALMLHVCGGAFPSTTTAPPHFTSSPRKWGDRREGPGDETFHHIMKGPLSPLLSPEGRYEVEQVQTSLLKFKHPGLRRLVCGEGGGRDGGGKKRCNPRQLSNPLSLREVNQRIVDFIQQQQQQQQDLCSGSSCNDTTLELKFLFLSRAMCRTIVSLAHAYQLACLVEEHKRRLPVASPRLRMTEHTKIATREEIEPILWKHGHKETTATNLGRAGRPASLSRESRSGSALIPSAGVNCILDESNSGNQMLQGMGWSPVMDLGPHCGGIRSPVKANLRTKHSGLEFT